MFLLALLLLFVHIPLSISIVHIDLVFDFDLELFLSVLPLVGVIVLLPRFGLRRVCTVYHMYRILEYADIILAFLFISELYGLLQLLQQYRCVLFVPVLFFPLLR